MLNKKHLFDATNAVLMVKQHEKEGLVKLGFYLLCFFYYLYRSGAGRLGHAHGAHARRRLPQRPRHVTLWELRAQDDPWPPGGLMRQSVGPASDERRSAQRAAHTPATRRLQLDRNLCPSRAHVLHSQVDFGASARTVPCERACWGEQHDKRKSKK